MNEVSDLYEFQVLPEEVATDDQFSDKTHEKAANVLYRLLASPGKGMTVGVEGTWGSGKSTVIALLKRKLLARKSKQSLFFIFDAWAHEGDPLRRIFLESLIREIDPSARDKALAEISETISNRKKTVNVTTRRTVSRLGKLLFITTLALPMGAALLSTVDYSKIVPPWYSHGGIDFPFLFGMLFSTAPFILLLIWVVLSLVRRGQVRWEIFESEATENFTQNITEDGERTSIEFEIYFGKILEHIFSARIYNYDKAIVVLDNLDRVSPDHASMIWSTMQTFFQNRSGGSRNNASWEERLWFLVPYDRVGLVRATGEDADTKDNGATTASYQAPKSRLSDASKSFISKNIQLIVEVPTPVLSGWDEYCAKCIKEALIGWPKPDQEIVKRVFQRYVAHWNNSPTPRVIRNYVNQVGVNGIRWAPEMSSEAIALYSLLRLDSTELEVRDKLRHRDNPYGYSVDADPEVIRKELAAMLFGVPKSKGMELLIGPVIQRALQAFDGEVLQKLIDDHGPAFWITWESIRGELVPGVAHDDDFKVNFVKGVHAGLRDYRDKIRRDLDEFESTLVAAASEKAWEREDYATALEYWADLTRDKENWLSWCASLADKKLAEVVSAFGAGGAAATKPEAVKRLAHLIAFLAPSQAALIHRTYAELGGSRWREWVEFLQPLHIDLPTVQPSETALSELAGLLRPNPNMCDQGVIACLTISLDQFPKSKGWEAIASTMVAWANLGNREANNNSAYRLMHKLSRFCPNSVQQMICTAVAGQPFWAKANQETATAVPNLPLLAGSCLGEGLQGIAHVSGAVKAFWARDKVEDTEIAGIYRELEELKSMDALWELSKDERNLFARNMITSAEAPEQLFRAPGALLCLKSLAAAPSGTLADIVLKLAESSDFDDTVETLREDPVKHSFAMYHLYRSGGIKGKEAVTEALTAVTQELWQQCLTDECQLLRLVAEDGIQLDDRYTDAFVEYVSQGMLGGVINDWVCENVSRLISKLLDRDMTIERLTTEYFRLDEDALADNGFDALSAYFVKYMDKQDSVEIMQRVNCWLDKQQWKRIRWITESGFHLKGAPIEALTSRVTRAFAAQDSELDGLLARLASIFNIDISEQNGGNDSGDA